MALAAVLGTALTVTIPLVTEAIIDGPIRDRDIDALLPALRRAAPFFRMQLAHEMRLRVAPQVSFQPDTTLDYAMHVDRLLRAPEVARDLAPAAPPADPEP